MRDFLGFEFYDNYVKNRGFLQVLRYPLVEDHLYRYLWVKDKLKGSCLDIACGSGWGTLQVSKNSNVSFVQGYDINPLAYKKAKSYDNNKVRFSRVNLLNNVPKKKFDNIIAFEIIEHFNKKDVLTLLENIKKFANKNTIIYISTPNKDAFSPLGYKWLPYHPIEYNINTLTEILKENGYKVNKIYFQRVLFKLPHKIISYIILFPVFFFKDKTRNNKFIRLLYGILSRVELFIGKNYYSGIHTEKSALFYPKYYILELEVSKV